MSDSMHLIIRQREYINSLLNQYGLNKKQFADIVRVAHSTISRLYDLEPESALSAKTLDKIAKNLNAKPFEFKPNSVPLVGYVTNGGDVTLFDQDKNVVLVEGPYEGATPNTKSIQIHDDGMWPVYKMGEILYYNEMDFSEKYYNTECIVKMTNGRLVICILKRGRIQGSYQLDSYNRPPIEDALIEWAYPITGTRKNLPHVAA